MRADSVTVSWEDWGGRVRQIANVGWESGGWTADGVVDEEGPYNSIHYVLRLDDEWNVRQFMLFRDADEPDLWLGTDGSGRWGELNGVHRPDLDGCIDIDLACTPLTNTVPIRRLGLDVGESAVVRVAMIDPETLAISPAEHRYERIGERQWRFSWDEINYAADIEVDEHGLVIDYPELFRRI
jgi:hypothetical protein